VLLQVVDKIQLQLPNETREVWLIEDPAAESCEVGQSGTADLLALAIELRKTVSHDGSQGLDHVWGAELGSSAMNPAEEAETLVRRQLCDAAGDSELVEEVEEFFKILWVVTINAAFIAIAIAALKFDHGEVSTLYLSAPSLCEKSMSQTLG
jgi:hypothetical protein